MSPRRPTLFTLGITCSLVALQMACAGPDPAPAQPGPASDASVPEAAPEAPAALAIDDVAPTDEVVLAGLTGKEIAEQICGECHSMEPPPLKAPPLTPLSRHLRESFETVDEAVVHVLSYAPAPDAARSILPEQAIERFGMMPPQPLPAPMLEAAARYIWTLSSEGDAERPMGMRRGWRGGGR